MGEAPFRLGKLFSLIKNIKRRKIVEKNIFRKKSHISEKPKDILGSKTVENGKGTFDDSFKKWYSAEKGYTLASLSER